jgi:organic hydroperoxide reductase OsmC/OhrA
MQKSQIRYTNEAMGCGPIRRRWSECRISSSTTAARLAIAARILLARVETLSFFGDPVMQEFPHYYTVTATGDAAGDVELTANRLPPIASASPAEFGGPGDRWSPEALITSALADCFVLTFRAVANASKIAWSSLGCDVTGTLDRVERVVQFTHFDITAVLTVREGTDPAAARRALEKAERACLVSNSVKASIHLDARIAVATDAGVLAAAK